MPRPRISVADPHERTAANKLPITLRVRLLAFVSPAGGNVLPGRRMALWLSGAAAVFCCAPAAVVGVVTCEIHGVRCGASDCSSSNAPPVHQGAAAEARHAQGV